MIITIEAVDYRLPVSLLEITLADRIRYDRTYGDALQKELATILKEEEDERKRKSDADRELELMVHYCSVACKTLSFFGNIPLEVVEGTKAEDVLTIYHQFMTELSEETDFSKERERTTSFGWKGDIWVIQSPQLKHDSTMTFGELVDSKQWMKNIETLGTGRWEALLMLCCIYLRKEGEKYTKELAYPEGKRYRLMQTLPLQHALEVGFFLNSSISSYLPIFRSFTPARESHRESTPASTMKPLAGSIS